MPRAMLSCTFYDVTPAGVPQVIAAIDKGCTLLVFLHMDGWRLLSVEFARRRTITATMMGRTGGLAPSLTVQ